jgi:hypothetical protein
MSAPDAPPPFWAKCVFTSVMLAAAAITTVGILGMLRNEPAPIKSSPPPDNSAQPVPAPIPTKLRSEVPAAPALARKPPAAPARKPKYSREELRQAVQDKTEPEVLELLGRPESTSEGYFDARVTHRWHYSRLTFDPVSQRVDRGVTIVFLPQNTLPDTPWRTVGPLVEFSP